MDILPIINRVKTLKGLSTDVQVADLIGLSGQAFSNRKSQGDSLLKPIVLWATREGIDLNWLLRGESQNPATNENFPIESDPEFKLSTHNRLTVLESKMDKILEFFDNPIEIDLDRKVSGEE